jgi:ATP-binding cassette subfamily B protein
MKDFTITESGRRSNRDKDQSRPLEYRLILRLFRYMRPYRRKRNLLLVIVITRAIQIPFLAWLVGRVISGPITQNELGGTLLGAAAFLILAVLTEVCFHYRIRLGRELGETVVHDLRRDVFSHLLKMPMSYFDRTRIGHIISRFTHDTESVRMGVQDIFFISALHGGQVLVSAALMLWSDPVLFLVVLGIAPFLGLLNYVFSRRMSRVTRAVRESWSTVTATLAESVANIRVTQGFVREEVNADQFDELIMDHSRYNLAVAQTNGTFMPLLNLHSQIFAALLLLAGGYRVLHADIHMDIGTLIQFLLLAGIFFNSIRTFGRLYHEAQSSMAGAERIFAFLDSSPEWEDPPDAKVLPPLEGRVEFRDVTFSYWHDRPALFNVSFKAEPNTSVALVGHTGSGKSSIAKLLAKFYLPDKGAVLIDGHDTLTISGNSLHRQMGFVSQSNFLFNGTVMENIRIGCPSASDEDVIGVVRGLDFLDIIGALPQGFSTQVGEQGSSLSLGQRQLVCFARAMMADPRILILDEATSAVDAITEERIRKALAALLKGRTSIIIAHRLSTIRNANAVLVIDRGRIVERGIHDDLAASGGAYSVLYKQFIQA